MKVAISNIAWPAEAEPRAAAILQEFGIHGVEIAPTTIWQKPLEASEQQILEYRRSWEQRGIRIVAMQALLFGRADLAVFGAPEKRRETLDYLDGVMRVGGLLGAKTLVFGSPKNRQRGAIPPDEARRSAAAFFREAAGRAVDHAVALCIEPNPPEYSCDFVTTSAEGLELVHEVGHPGFGLHLDAGGITLTGDAKTPDALDACMRVARHFHASEPFLGPLGEKGSDHRGLAAALRRLGYSNWVSVEMRHDPGRELEPELRRVLTVLQETYGG
jgi:sugar phosphate isomerase/epimerase